MREVMNNLLITGMLPQGRYLSSSDLRAQINPGTQINPNHSTSQVVVRQDLPSLTGKLVQQNA